MNVVLGVLIVVAVAALAIAAMLIVRRRSPEGSWFADGDRASGVFGVLATGFSVLLGFIVFLAFTSYDQSRAGAEDEARLVAQQIETAQLLPEPARDALTGQLICYARSVISREWPDMEDGTIGDRINPWGVAMFRTIAATEPVTAREQSAYDQWLGQTADREDARQDRVHGAVGVIPTPIWIVLFLVAGIIFAYMLFFADPGERAVTQAMLMGSVTVTITALMLLLAALDRPFSGEVGSLRPVSMERTLDTIDQSLRAIGRRVDIPCDAGGIPVRS